MNTTETAPPGSLHPVVRHRPIELGALCPKLSHQLRDTRIKPDRLRILDKLSDSINWCYLHHLITDAETERARRRLIRKVQEELDSSKPPKVPNIGVSRKS